MIKAEVIAARSCAERREPGGHEEYCGYKEPEADGNRSNNKSCLANRAVIVHTAVIVMMECYCNDA